MRPPDITPDNRADWLAERRATLGGSDLTALFFNVWGGPWKVWQSKCDPQPNKQTDDMFMGRAVESMLAEWFTNHHPDIEIADPGDYIPTDQRVELTEHGRGNTSVICFPLFQEEVQCLETQGLPVHILCP